MDDHPSSASGPYVLTRPFPPCDPRHHRRPVHAPGPAPTYGQTPPQTRHAQPVLYAGPLPHHRRGEHGQRDLPGGRITRRVRVAKTLCHGSAPSAATDTLDAKVDMHSGPGSDTQCNFPSGGAGTGNICHGPVVPTPMPVVPNRMRGDTPTITNDILDLEVRPVMSADPINVAPLKTAVGTVRINVPLPIGTVIPSTTHRRRVAAGRNLLTRGSRRNRETGATHDRRDTDESTDRSLHHISSNPQCTPSATAAKHASPSWFVTARSHLVARSREEQERQRRYAMLLRHPLQPIRCTQKNTCTSVRSGIRNLISVSLPI